MEKRLYRKTTDRVLGGVCGGLAEYVGMDKGGMRFLVLLGILASGVVPGLLLYVVCMLFIPTEESLYGGSNNWGNNGARPNNWQSGGWQGGANQQGNPSGSQGSAYGSQGSASGSGYTGSTGSNYTANGRFSGASWNDAKAGTPEDDYSNYTVPPMNNTTGSGRGKYILGGALVLGGALILLRPYIGWIDPRLLFAGGLVLFGLYLLFGKGRK